MERFSFLSFITKTVGGLFSSPSSFIASTLVVGTLSVVSYKYAGTEIPSKVVADESETISSDNQKRKNNNGEGFDASSLLAADRRLQKNLNSASNSNAGGGYDNYPSNPNGMPYDSGNRGRGVDDVSPDQSSAGVVEAAKPGFSSGSDSSFVADNGKSEEEKKKSSENGNGVVSGGGGGGSEPTRAPTSDSNVNSGVREKEIYFQLDATKTVVAGQCTEVIVSVTDIAKRPSPTTQLETLVVDHTSSAQFFSDSACTVNISNTPYVVPVNTRTFSLYIKDTLAENFSYNLATRRKFIGDADQSVKVIPDAVENLKITGSSLIKSGACSGPYIVKLYDQYANLAPSTSSLTFTISDLGFANAYSDASCVTPQTSYTTTGTTTEFTFYLKDTHGELITVKADDAGSIQAGTLSVQVDPSIVELIATSPVRSGDCVPLAVNLKDANNTISTVHQALTVNLTETKGWKFYGVADSTCAGSEITAVNFVSGDSTKAIYYKPTGSGAVTISGTDPSSYLTTGTKALVVGPRSLDFVHSALVSAGSCNQVKVKTLDSIGADALAISTVNVNLSKDKAGAQFYLGTDTTCSGATINSTSIPAGSSEVTIRFKDGTAETVVMTAVDAAGTLITDNSPIVVGPNGLSISGSTTIRSGDCEAYTISSLDAFATLSPAIKNYSLSFSDLTAQGEFYAGTDSTCSGPTISTIALAAGASSLSFRYKNNKAETVSLNIDDTGGELDSGILSVSVGPKDLEITGPSQILSGNCSTYTVKYKDVLGNYTSTNRTHTLNLADATPEGTFYSDSACTAAINSMAVASGVATTTVYYQNTKGQNTTLTVSGSTSELTSHSTAVAVGPYKLTLSGATETRSDDCELYTVETKDVLNNVVAVLTATTVNYSDASAQGSFYASADTTCSGATVSSASLAVGQSSVLVRYKNPKSEVSALNITDGAAGLQAVTSNLNVGPKTATISIASQLISGLCNAVSVVTKDSQGTTAAVIRATTINLDDGAGSGTFYSDSGCTAAITSTNLAIGASTSNIYYKDNTAELLTLSAADAAAWLATGTINTQTGPYKIEITGTTPILAGTCRQYTVTTKDFANNVTGVLANTSITLNRGSSTTMNFYGSADNTCSGSTISSLSFAIGDSTHTFYAKDAKAETVAVGASDGASGMVDGSLNVVVGPDRLVLTENSTPHRSGDCDAFTITSRDAQPATANVLAATIVNLTDDSANGQFYSDSACTAATTTATIANGASSVVVYYKDPVKEVVNLTATDAAAILSSSTSAVSFGPYKIELTGSSPVLAGTCHQYTVTTKDFANNVAGVLSSTTITLGRGSSTTMTYYGSADSTCSGAAITTLSFAAGESVKTFYAKDAKAETVAATASDGASGMVDGSLNVVVGPDRLTLTENSTPHRSGDCDAFTITSRDAQPAAANVLSATTINLTDDTTNGQFYSDSACTSTTTTATIASGASSVVVYYKDPVKESINLTATDAAAVLTASTLAVNVGPYKIELTGSSPVLAGTCHQYTVTTKDFANNVAGVLSSTTITLGRGSSTTMNYYAAADNTCSGATITSLSFAIGDSVKTFYAKDAKAETVAATASDGASGMVDGSLNVVVGPDRLVLTENSTPHRSGDCDAFTITSRDAQPATANVLSATTINLTDDTTNGQFYSDAACTSTTTTATIAMGASSVIVYYKDLVKENINLTATDAAAVLTTSTLPVSIGPREGTLVGNLTPRASDCSQYSLTLRDGAGNAAAALAPTTMNLTDGSAAGAFYDDADTTCSGPAITSVVYAIGESVKYYRYKDPRAEAVTLTMDDGPGGLNAVNYNITVGPSKITVNGRAGISWNYCRIYNFRTRDEQNNVAGVLVSTTIDIDDTGGSGAFYSDSSCTTPVSSLTFAAGVSQVSAYYMSAVKELVTLTAVDQAAYLASGSLNVEVGAEKLVVAGASPIRSGECIAYTAQSLDADDIPQNVLQNVSVALDDGTGNGQMYASADTTCSGAPVTAITMTTGTNIFTFHYKNNSAQTVTVNANDGNGGRDPGALSVVVGPDRAILSGGNRVSINGCIPYQILPADTASSGTSLVYATTFDLTTTSGTGAFYDTGDTTCSGSTITSKTLAIGAPSGTIYYKDTVSGNVTLTSADQTSYLISSSLNVEVGADRLAITGTTPIRANECGLYTVHSRNNTNADQNVLNNAVVALTDATAAGTFYNAADTTCTGAAITNVTITSGNSTVDFRYKDARAEALTISADDGTNGLSATTYGLTIGPDHLTLTGSSGINAGKCVQYTINSADAQPANANVLSTRTIDLSDGSAAGDFYASGDSTCAGATINQININSGSNSATFYYKNPTSESVTLAVDDSAAYLTGATLSVSVGPGQLLLSGSGSFRSGECEAFTVTSQDINSTVANVLTNTTINLSDAASSGNFYGSTDTGCTGSTVSSVQINSGSSSVVFHYKNNKAETSTLTVSDGTTTMASDSRSVTTTARSLAFSGSTTAIAGACVSYTLQVRDAQPAAANVLANTTVALSDGTASGDFYASADTTCSGAPISSVMVASGSSSVGFRYRNPTAQAAILTGDDVGPLDDASLTLTTGPSQLTLTGSTPISTNECALFTVQSQDTGGTAANATSNIIVNLTDGSAAGAFYAAGDTTCAGAPISSATILNGSNSVNFRYKDAIAESLTLNADDAGGAVSSASFSLTVELPCVGSFKVEPLSGGTPTYSFKAGETFNVRVTAIDGGGATRTCYTGSRTLTWTMHGSTASTFNCGETSGAPNAPTETTMVFTNGVATTTSNTAKFKVVENATIEVTQGSNNGTSNAIAIGEGDICKLKLMSAANGGGSEVTVVNLDLQIDGSTPNSDITLYAAGFDAFGNYIQDVTTAWSGTGVVSPVPQTTTSPNDTVHVVGSQVGTGVLTGDYAGGGGDKTVAVNFTVTDNNAMAFWNSSTMDFSSHAIMSSSQVADSIAWEPSVDVTHNWINTGSQSWRSEAFVNGVRGSRADFPAKVFVVGSATGVDVIDTTAQSLWMKLAMGSGYALDSAYGPVSSVAALNGRIFVGLQNALIVLDLANDQVQRIDASGLYTWSKNISQRNSGGSWTLIDNNIRLSHSSVIALKAVSSGAYSLVAVGTQSGGTLLQISGSTFTSAILPTSNPVTAVAVTSSNAYFAENQVGIHRVNLSLPMSSPMSAARVYTNMQGVVMPSLDFNDLDVAVAASTREAGQNALFVATTKGLVVIHEHSTQNLSGSNMYAAQSASHAGFGAALMTNGAGAVATIPFAGSALGPAQGHATTVEFWFSPTQNISSGNAVLLERGTGAGAIKIAIAGGRIRASYTNASGITSFVQTSRTWWAQGTWYHFAVVISATGIEMWMNGADHQVQAVDLSAETLASATTYLGASSTATNFLPGLIDELRISKVARYSGATFALAGTEFTNDSDTVALYHFNSQSGGFSGFADTVSQQYASLASGAVIAHGKLIGYDSNVTAIAINTSGGSVTCEVITAGGWTEVSQCQNPSTAAVTRSESVSGYNDIFIYQVQGLLDLDIGLSSQTNGLYLIRK